MFNNKTAPMTNGSSAIQEVNKVYKTSDLSIFKEISGNRVPNPQHVKRLTDSIKQNGMLCNPILVNESMRVIDGQHRLLASKDANSHLYFIILDGYSLNEVHTLNLNQKNWTKKDFMDGYADMGLESYKKLQVFVEKNTDFSFGDCIAMCSNLSTDGGFSSSQKNRSNKKNGELSNISEIFVDGTWRGKNFDLANEWAEKLRLIKPYYVGYNKSTFVGTMLSLFINPIFDYSEFMHKIRIQPKALVDCANREQQKLLIEEIYNYKSRNKVNLRY
jgi:hypothetical protein